MGRMLDTLKHGDTRRSLAPAASAVHEAPELERVVDWEIGAEVPFVEVGGPNKKLELSPGLMKHPAQALTQAPHLSVDAAARPKAVQLTAAPPMAVAFEPWTVAPKVVHTIAPEIVAYHQPESAASKEYAVLLDAMLTGMQTGAGPVLLLAGLRPKLGATTVLLNLAVTAARAKKLRVVLVDGASANSVLAERLGCTASAGLADVLAGSLALEHALVTTAIPSLSVLPAGSKDLAVNGPALAWLLGWLRDRNDLIFIDGPTLQTPDALAKLAPLAHATYVVLPRGETVPLGKGIAQSINGVGGRLCGLIHTHYA